MFDEGQWTVATTFGNEAEAALAQGFLESHGVLSQVESRAFRQEPVNFGSLAIVKLWVAPADLERARALIEERSRFSLVRSDEADLGDLGDLSGESALPPDDQDRRRGNG